MVEDRVQGRVVVQNKQLDDMIILRSDGTPTYNFAVVVDDHDMGVTHVIRGVDHLTNAARQVQIYKAMGWDVPVFAHVPLIHGPDGAKLSKRHGALGIEAYRAMGYLPAGLRNYLVRLGWSHGDDEIFSTAQAIQWFDIDDINKSPGRLDFAKLADVNGHYIRQASDEELIGRLKDLLPHLDDGARNRRQDRKGGLGSVRCRSPDAQGAGQDAARPDRRRCLPARPSDRWPWTTRLPRCSTPRPAQPLPSCCRSSRRRPTGPVQRSRRACAPFAEATGQKLGKVAQPLRAALTGRTVSPPVFDVMAVLGREEAIARLRDQAG